MDKETELAYLKNLLASSQDVVNVLETIAAQFKSMEQSSQSTSQSCIRSRGRYGHRVQQLVHRVFPRFESADGRRDCRHDSRPQGARRFEAVRSVLFGACLCVFLIVLFVFHRVFFRRV